MIRILFLGDVFGRTGRRLVRELLPDLTRTYEVDLVVANVENAAGGIGLTIKAADELFASGIDVMTSGNHIFRHAEIVEYMEQNERLIRPANYPAPCPGQGAVLVTTRSGARVGVVNLLGRVFMEPLESPFETADLEIAALARQGARAVLVDVHAEATSEKRALAWYLSGRVQAVIGTHTHVQTADETILAGGTAYITDAGMTGPHDSVIGMKKETILERFLTGRPVRFEAARKGLRLEGVVIGLAEDLGRAVEIVRIQRSLPA